MPSDGCEFAFSSRVPPKALTIKIPCTSWNYQNNKRDTYTKVRGLVQDALDALVRSSSQGNVGFFTVTLTWDGSGDVDLHVFEPTGTHIFYANKQGDSGFLDVDNRVAKGPEHYVATCDPTRLATGTYQIGINNFARANGRIATVQVATEEEGEIFTTQLGVGSEQGSNGDNSPIPVVKVVVFKDAEGNFQAGTP
jgi:hypothetical protein